MSEATERERVLRERDLFYRLLSVGLAEDAAPYAAEVLALLLELTGATGGFLVVEGSAGAPPLLEVSRGLDDHEKPAIRESLSTGIIRDALRTRRTISTASATSDPRFAGFQSVQAGRIQAVLCAPLAAATSRGDDVGSIGVLYLTGRKAPGPFPEADRALTDLAASVIGPHVDRLLRGREEPGADEDHTTELRRRLPGFDLAGRSSALAGVMRAVLAAAGVPVTVLLRGESGTGKSAVARALHEASSRRAGPFIEVNVAALPETLLEGELFGAERGAHSQAHQRMIGKVEAAEGGTLFLDEIGELPLASQAKLLSFLQTKRFTRLGSTTTQTADVRIVAATNKDLEAAVAARAFREDLYYRLNVLEILLPPLRERAEDVADVAVALAARLATPDAPALPLSRASLRALAESDWPGNVRQLENTIARGWAAALADGAFAIEPAHLFGRVSRTSPGAADGVSEPASGPREASAGPTVGDFQEKTREFQARLVERALTETEWNVSEAARRLSLSRSRLNELIRSFGLSRGQRSLT